MGILIELIVVIIILKLNRFVFKKHFIRKKYDVFHEGSLLVVYMISKGFGSVLWQIAFISMMMIPILFIILIMVKENIKRMLSIILIIVVLIINSLVFDMVRSNITIKSDDIDIITITHEGRIVYLSDQEIIDSILNAINNNKYKKDEYSLFSFSHTVEIVFFDKNKEEVERFSIVDFNHVTDGVFSYKTERITPIEYLMEQLQ